MKNQFLWFYKLEISVSNISHLLQLQTWFVHTTPRLLKHFCWVKRWAPKSRPNVGVVVVGNIPLLVILIHSKKNKNWNWWTQSFIMRLKTLSRLQGIHGSSIRQCFPTIMLLRLPRWKTLNIDLNLSQCGQSIHLILWTWKLIRLPIRWQQQKWTTRMALYFIFLTSQSSNQSPLPPR